jgi:hypothetical protein
VFEFNTPVRFQDGDGDLDKKLEEEIPNIILKINRAYRDKTQECGHDTVWRHLPQYFKGTSDSLVSSLNVLESFLASDKVEYGEDKMVTLDVLKQGLMAFMQENNLPRVPMNTSDFWRVPLQKRGLQISKEQFQVRGRSKLVEVVKGLELIDSGMAGDIL